MIGMKGAAFVMACMSEAQKSPVVTYYTEEDDTAKDKEVSVDFGKEGEYEIYLLDKDRNAELVDTTKNLTFTMKPCSCILIKEL